MATTLAKLASCPLTYEVYAKILAGTYTLPAGVMVDSVADNGDGATVQVNFSGSGLGAWATPQPVTGHVEVSPDNVVYVEAVGSSSGWSSSGA